MKIAYFDCFAGAAGDMIAAALLDAGLDRNFLLSQLNSLNIEGLEIKIEQTSRCGLAALTFKPLFPHQHHHRNLDDVTGIINNSGISNDAKQTAVEIFENLAQAEAVVHGKAKEKIHFHEVGAVDSIVDIVAAAIGFHYFKDNGVNKFLCSKISIGSGSTQTEHGLMPVPAPATLELIKGVPVTAGPADFELLTPTAAAILKTIIDDYCPLPTVQVENVGCGAGSKNPDSFPNILRLIICQAVDSDEAEADCICLLETNIDDQTPETIGFAADLLLKEGALDVYTTPIFMKHNRPAVKLSVICKPQDEQKITHLIFQQELTFGIRKQLIPRAVLARTFVSVDTQYGRIKIKVGKLSNKVVVVKPEFSDCAAAAQKHNVSIKEVFEKALINYRKQIEST